jgi:hypothetical protein
MLSQEGHALMNLLDIISLTQSLRPKASDEQVVRWVLMMLVSQSPITEESLAESLTFVEQSNRLMSDQASAVAEELDSLASTQPSEFCPSHIWTLLKAIRVQKQILDLYEADSIEATTESQSVVCGSL